MEPDGLVLCLEALKQMLDHGGYKTRRIVVLDVLGRVFAFRDLGLG